MSRDEVGTLTRWEIFRLLCSATDEFGQILVDEYEDNFYETMRNKHLNEGFGWRRSTQWAAEAVNRKKQQEEENRWRMEAGEREQPTFR
jgi:hypothetical protein